MLTTTTPTPTTLTTREPTTAKLAAARPTAASAIRGGALLFAVGLLLSTGLAAGARAQDTARPDAKKAVKHYNLPKNGTLAINGFDPVAYFPDHGGKPKKGKKGHQLAHQGVTYRFASAKNLAAFKKNPARFAPAYGGWCAYAMASGEKVSVNPKAFRVTDNRLFLFYTSVFTDTRKPWKKKEAKLMGDADDNWRKISGESPRKGKTQTKR